MKYPTIRIEGSILSSDILEKIELGEISGQNPKDFGFDSNTKVKDEIAAAWADSQSYWKIYQRKIEKLKDTDSGTSDTRQVWMIPFFSLFGYQIEKSNAEILNEKTYAISHISTNLDGFPIHIMGCNDFLDKKPESGTLRMSPHALVQEYLNLTEHLYAIVTNGFQLRILRDSSRLVKLSYLEFNLEQMFEEEHYSDFALMFRLIHSSRMPKKMDGGSESLIEDYHQDSLESGSRIREGLSLAVANSIKMFADGFMNNPANQALRDNIDNNRIDSAKLYQIMLRLIYRILFVTVIEERNLIYPKECNKQKRDIYYQFYSISRLRNICDKRYILDSKFNDLWINLKQTFKLFEDEKFGAALDIKPLNGDLFGYNALDIINECELDNKILLTCIRSLSLFTNKNGTTQRVNYASLNVEEFGSVYEGLLEFAPQILKNGSYNFIFAKGDERSKTGSHYTPDELVKPLIKHSLEYLIVDKLDLSRKIANSEWQMVKKDNSLLSIIKSIYENEQLSRPGSVEKGNVYSRTSVPLDETISQRGTVWNDFSNTQSSSFDTGEPGGRLGQAGDEGISSIYKDSQREFEGIGNSSDIGKQGRAMHTNSNRTNTQRPGNTEQANAEFTKKSVSESELASWWKNLSSSYRYSQLAIHYLLSLKVCDVACGSGHILLSAARRLAHEVAKARTGEDQPSPQSFREAIREVIRNCIYGVDKNPLAVELCKVSLWLEAHNPGEPLSFLDHKIKCGDSIVGLAHREELEKGIADEAFKRLPDDDKDIASAYLKKNKDEKKIKEKGWYSLDFEKEFGEKLGERAKLMLDFINMPEHTPQQITAKKQRFEQLNQDEDWWRLKTLADIQTAQFFIPKTQANKDFLITEAEYRQYLSHDKPFDARKSGKAIAVSQEKRFFHWFLEFPEVFVASSDLRVASGKKEEVNSELLLASGKKEEVNSELRLASGMKEEENGNANTSSPFATHHSLLATNHSPLTSSGFDCILGNPPFLGGQKLTGTFGNEYLEYLKFQYSPIGSCDLVTYFFRRIFGIVKENGFQSLISTNTIAQGGAREGGLDVIQSHNGKINFAIRSMKWPGLAAVEVALVAIHKGIWNKEFVLDNKKVNNISTYLDDSDLIGNPYQIIANSNLSFMGSTVFGKGFFLENYEAKILLKKDINNKNIIFPILNGEDLLNKIDHSPDRFVINFFDYDIDKAKAYQECFKIIEERVKPQRLEQKTVTAKEKWWLFHRLAEDLYKSIRNKNRVISCAITSKTLGFCFEPTNIIFSNAIIVFNFDKYFHFLILQSTIHNNWSWKYSSTMKNDLRYTPSDSFETFPFPQNLDQRLEQKLESIGENYHEHRQQLMLGMQLGLTKTYNLFHCKNLIPGLSKESAEAIKDKDLAHLIKHFAKGEPTISFDEAVAGIIKLRELHVQMDNAVLDAYGWGKEANSELREANSEKPLATHHSPIALKHDFYEVDYLPENDRVRFTIHPDARKGILKRLLELNHKIHEEEVKAGLWDKKKWKKKEVKTKDVKQIF